METEDPHQHEGEGPVAAGIADQARRAAADGGDEAFSSLTQAVSDASPDERSAAAKELIDDRPAYELLHRALGDLGIEPADPDITPEQTT